MPDIRTVVKWHAGSDPGELLNMIGRAARDGAPARIAVCATQLDMRRPRTAPRAPTEAQARRAHHALLWQHSLLAEMASGRGAWAVWRAYFGEAPAQELRGGPDASAHRMGQLLLELLRAHAAAEHDDGDEADPQFRSPPPSGAIASAAEEAVGHAGPRSGGAQEWVHARERRDGGPQTQNPGRP